MDKLKIRIQGKTNEYRKANTFHLLADIQVNYHNYLAFKSIRSLRSFLSGYHYVASAQEIQKEANLKNEDFDKFIYWIAKKYQITSSHSWSSIILLHTEDEIEAFDRFYMLLEEYRTANQELSAIPLTTDKREIVKQNYQYELTQPVNVVEYFEDIRDLLKDVKKRPYFYLDSYALSHLYSFLQGYAQAKIDFCMPVGSDEQELSTFLLAIENKLESIKDTTWLKVIIFNSSDEKDALDQFFSLWEKRRLHRDIID